MDLVYDYISFTMKVLTAVLGVIAVLAFSSKKEASKTKQPSVTLLNDQVHSLKLRWLEAMAKTGLGYAKECLKQQKKTDQVTNKARKNQSTRNKCVFCVSFDGNLAADGVKELRQEISAVLMFAQPDDEVLLILESPGGAVNGYGLLAAQLERIKNAGVELIVCVDKVAASGGYLGACVADSIIAAPFALIGSIGVVSTVPNFFNFLKSQKVDVLEMTAGKHKRPLSMLGKPSKEGIAHVQQQLTAIHEQFKACVKRYRPQVETELACTGDYWTAEQAQSLHLVDRLATSDEILEEKMRYADVYRVETPKHKTWLETLQGSVLKLWHLCADNNTQ